MNLSLLLPVSIVLPFLVAGILLVLPLGKRCVYAISLGTSIVLLLGHIALLSHFPWQDGGLDWEAYLAFQVAFPEGLGLLSSLQLGLTPLSIWLFCLVGVLGFVACWQSMCVEVDRQRLYFAMLFIFQGGLYGAFSALNVFFFYIFHECSLVAGFVTFLLWGRGGRTTAVMEMALYLTVGAILTLAGIFLLWEASGWQSGFGFQFSDIVELGRSGVLQPRTLGWIGGVFLFGFGILVSLFPFYGWAIRTYGLAPTGMAILHAGALKQVGLYGLIQIVLPVVGSDWGGWKDVWVYLALGNVCVIGLIASGSDHLRRLVAYGSVMHVGYAFLGLAVASLLGLGAVVLLMLAYGLSVATLLVLATCVERRTLTVDLQEMGGLANDAPKLAGLFIVAQMASIGLPGFGNFWGELGVFVAVWREMPWVLLFAVFGIVLSAVYSLRAIALIFYGKPTESFEKRCQENVIKDVNFLEAFPIYLCLCLLLFLGLFPNVVLEPVQYYLSALFQRG